MVCGVAVKVKVIITQKAESLKNYDGEMVRQQLYLHENESFMKVKG